MLIENPKSPSKRACIRNTEKLVIPAAFKLLLIRAGSLQTINTNKYNLSCLRCRLIKCSYEREEFSSLDRRM
jgi:hypothetical protein